MRFAALRRLRWLAALPLSITGLALCLGCVSGAAAADDYPARPITIVVPFAPGGPTDTSARLVATAMSKQMNASVIIENVPGAGAVVGATKVAQSKADGYTLLWASASPLAMAPHLYAHVPYDPIKSFDPVGLVVSQPFVLVVNPSLGVTSLKAFVDLAKSKPDKLNFGSTGNGASSHLVAELFMAAAHIRATHIPYNGGAPAINAVMAGNVDFYFDTPTTTVPLIKAGKLNGLAVTSATRWDDIPEIPTLQESGYAKFDATTWFGLVAPKGTPADRIGLLSRNLSLALKDPQVVAALHKSGFLVAPSSPQDFAAKIRAELVRWGDAIKLAGVKLE